VPYPLSFHHGGSNGIERSYTISEQEAQVFLAYSRKLFQKRSADSEVCRSFLVLTGSRI
jgi:hypothetical protein